MLELCSRARFRYTVLLPILLFALFNLCKFQYIFYFKFTEEKLGTSEKTELDAHFENLSHRCDLTKSWTEKLVRDIDAVLTPNPGMQTFISIITLMVSLIVSS